MFTNRPGQVLDAIQMQSPGGAGVATIRPSFAATGRGWRHPTFTGRRPAPGRRARWLEVQGDRCVGYRRVPAMALDASDGVTREAGLKAPLPASPEPHGVLPRAGWFRKLAAVIEKSPGADAERRPRWGRATAPLNGCGVGVRVPVAPSRLPPAGLVVLPEREGNGVRPLATTDEQNRRGFSQGSDPWRWREGRGGAHRPEEG